MSKEWIRQDCLEKLFEQSPFGLTIKDADFVFVDANPSFCACFGHTLDSLLGKRADDFLNKNASEYFKNLDTQVLNGKTVTGRR